MGVKDDYPYCKDIIESKYLPLLSTGARSALYVKTNNDRFVFDNPLHLVGVKRTAKRGSLQGMQMRTRDFLATIPAFSDFSDQQLIALEQKAQICKYGAGDIVFRQGEDGDRFYVINKGSVDVLIQESSLSLERGDFGRIVNRLNEGCYFGERALVRSEPRAATIRVNQDLVCLAFSREVYEEVISGSNALVGQEGNMEDVDWSKDHETRSIFKHVENILEIEKMTASPKIKRILYELSTAFTPELSPDEIIARMVMTVKVALRVDRVGLFVLSEDKKTMVLKVSERSKGVRLPLRGLAGEILRENAVINISDAYKDARFDATMDKRTGYRTRQVLGVPLRHPVTGEAMGALQVNNKLDRDNECFTPEQQRVLELAAVQLSELLIGRADVFIHSGSVGTQRSYGQGVGDGLVLLSSSELNKPFTIDISGISVGRKATEIISRENLTVLEIQVSLFLALTQLCPSQSVFLDINGRFSTRINGENEMQFNSRDRLTFDLDVKDLPRAARIMLKLIGYKKKRGLNPTPQQASNNRIFLGWAACTTFDFKGCLECFQELKLFPSTEREILVPINTTLSNKNETSVASVSAILAPDIVLAEDVGTPRVRVVHSMPNRSEPFGDRNSTDDLNDPAYTVELERILKLSFNPMSHSMMTETDKEFLWKMRYNIFNKAKLLPAFVMSVRWNKAEDVQELYDLLDLWEPATPVEALQLLDRRFMDPKVRAYAVHCLEELPDDELALYMLQLCQQLKFETFIDSALARFLLRRALTNQRLIGHIYFWLLQSELYNSDVSQRYVTLLQVTNCS